MDIKQRVESLVLALSLTFLAGMPLLFSGIGEPPKKEDPWKPWGGNPAAVVRVAATAVPHAEMLERLKPQLAQNGTDLRIIECGDYDSPNAAVAAGEADANFFQTRAFLERYNEETGAGLVEVAAVHYEPMGVYPGKTTALADLPVGAYIGVPRDPVNQSRALRLLEELGIITLRADAGRELTVNDLAPQEHINIQPMDPAALPHMDFELDLMVINGNFAIQAGLSPQTDALALEDAAGAGEWANVLAVWPGMEQEPSVQALAQALTGPEMREYLLETYAGGVLPLGGEE